MVGTAGNVIYGIIQLLIAIVLAVVSLYIGFSVFGKIMGKIDQQNELAKGNVAVGILVASIFISIAIVIQSGISGISIGLKNAVSGDIISLISAILQLLIGIVLAIVGIYIALKVLDKMTKGVEEFAEIEKGNIAVALEMAGVIISVALIIQSGVIGITSVIG